MLYRQLLSQMWSNFITGAVPLFEIRFRPRSRFGARYLTARQAKAWPSPGWP